MAGFLIVNPHSGDGKPGADELVAEAQRRGIVCHVLADGDDCAELGRAADADALGIAGGDGSLSAVAQVALDRKLPFVCIPFGTRNHFARDLGLDRNDPIGALDSFGGAERRVDVGRVNDHVFLNNVSLGLYAGLVEQRERHRHRGEALAGLRALRLLAGDHDSLRAVANGERVTARVLLVANGRYQVSLLTLGERASLTGGQLHLYSAAGLLPRFWRERNAPRYELQLDTVTVKAAVDGDPAEFESPLMFELLPRGLRVLVPPALVPTGAESEESWQPRARWQRRG